MSDEETPITGTEIPEAEKPVKDSETAPEREVLTGTDEAPAAPDVDPAVKAGWNPADGESPYQHGTEPADAIADGPGE